MKLTEKISSQAHRVEDFEEANPSSVLGPHEFQVKQTKNYEIRAFLPRAKRAWIELPSGTTKEMKLVDSRGFWSVKSSKTINKRYKLAQQDESGFIDIREDPYAFPPQLSDYDLYLFNEGTHRKAYERLGAHIKTVLEAKGVHFAVWAPNARSVALVGNFNHWQVGETPMMSRGASGVWEIFVPGLSISEVYKFAIKSNADGKVSLKTDPFAFLAELRPRTAAVVNDLDSFKWTDDRWMERRSEFNSLESPISIYEVHIGSWKKKQDGSYLIYRELADELIDYVKALGFTHVELMPVMEHPLDDSWGYQVVNYFAPTSRFGSPEDFMYFIGRCHEKELGVILDWVPAHFPKDEYGLAMFDGTHLFNHADPRVGEQPDWNTLIFNLSRKEVRSFLISNALFWLDKYHVDGLRLDAVASMLYLDYSRKPTEWIPNKYGGRENLEALDFLRDLNDAVHKLYPDALTIAEESTAWPAVTCPVKEGGLGFDMKWNMGWMHDTLKYFSTDPIFRKHIQDTLTFSLLYAFGERYVLVFSHDEVVYGKRSLLSKMPGDEWQRFANLRLCFSYMFTHPGKKLLFMGDEFGQRNEWNFRDGLDWWETANHRNSQLSLLIHDLNELYTSKHALHDLDFSYDGFEWVDFTDAEKSIVSYIRKPKEGESFILTVCNLTPVPRYEYRVGVPEEAFYKEILNSDALEYGGSGVGNLGGVKSDPVPWHGRPHSLSLTLPPLAAVVFEYKPESGLGATH